MLRQVMRDPRTGSDAAFFAFLRAVRAACAEKPLTTELFREIAEKHVVRAANIDQAASLEWFFDQWVYATGIPEVKVKTTIETRAAKLSLTGVVHMDGVDENFSLPVPIYGQTLRGQSLLGIAMAVGRETKFNFPLAARPLKVLVDPQATLLAVFK
jgi:aminopeptidase N